MTLPPRALIEPILTNAVLPSVVGAGVVAGLILLIGYGVKRKLGPLAAGLGLIVGIALGNHFIEGTIGYLKQPPGEWDSPDVAVRYTEVPEEPESEERVKRLQITLPEPGYRWLPWAAIILIVHGMLTRVPGIPAYVGVVLRLEATILATFMLVPETWRMQEPMLLAIFAIVSFAQWQILDMATCRQPGAGFALSLSILIAAAGFLASYRFPTLFQWAVVLSSCWCGLALIAWWPKTDLSGAIGATLVLLNGILLNEAFNNFSENPDKYDPDWILGLAGLLWVVPLGMFLRIQRGWIILIVQWVLIIGAITAAMICLFNSDAGLPWDGLG